MPFNPWIALEALSTATLKLREGRYAEAERHCLKALAETQKQGTPAVQVAQALFLTATNYHLWATHGAPGKFREAEGMYQQALTAREAVGGPSDEYALQTRLTLADLYSAWVEAGNVDKMANVEGALQGWLTAAGSDSPQTPEVLSRLADVYESTGRLDKAELELMRALEIADRITGPRSDLSARLQEQLASVRRGQRGNAAR